MLRRFAEERFSHWILGELERSRERVRALREKHPAATSSELAQRLIDEKKKWASTGGAVSGLFGAATLPADLAFVSWLQLTLIVDLAVLCGRNLKSARARQEVLEIFLAASTASRTASRASPKAVARIAERLFTLRGLRFFGRAVPLVAAPITAAFNNRDLQKAGDEALRIYSVIPTVLRERRTLSR